MNLTQELYRKSIHFLLISVPVTYYFLGKWKSLAIFATVTTIVVALDYLRRSNPKIKIIFEKIFGSILRPHELTGDRLCGASWAGLAACLTFLLFKEEIAVTAFVILAISDAAASLVGKSFNSQPFFEKSTYGAAAFFSTGIIVILVCGGIYHAKFWFYFFGLFALMCTTIIESRPSFLDIDDNFTVPVSFATIMTFFDFIWNYSY